MSAPLTVNLGDGSCWVRHAVTRGGIALYVLGGVIRRPEPVMATLPELAQHGITGSSFALPMPAGPSTPTDELTQLRARVAELETAPTAFYRAEHADSGIVLGHYSSGAAARKHCETRARREIPGACLDWIGDDEDDGDGVAELIAAFGEDERSTGYIVTGLELASEYDEEADE